MLISEMKKHGNGMKAGYGKAYHAILGISPGAGREEIKAAYPVQGSIHHPNAGKGDH